jgi:multiple sugar transport system permease protein
MTAAAARLPSLTDRSPSLRGLRSFLGRATVTLFAVILLSAFLLPLLYMVATSLQQTGQRATPGAPIYPAVADTYNYQGKDYPVYDVPMPDGTTRRLALIEPHREESTFVDPTDPTQAQIVWVGRWRTLSQVWTFAPQWQNYSSVWSQLDFPRILFNTAAVAVLSTIGAVGSSILVAYGFSRFAFPGKNVLFIILIATIILPFQVTLIPQYAVYTALGWNGTWLPLIIPHYFANAFNVFLLRQYFMSIPRDLDEAAMMDGAGPFRILRSVIMPLSIPAITAVALFHFFWSWNDFFVPLLYLSTKPDLQTLPIALQIQFNAQYASQPTLLQAAALMTMAVPVVVFFLAQRAFMRGVVVTGVEK